jgi:succinate dehydrogenase/fumarate reductase cytochrome b subunit
MRSEFRVKPTNLKGGKSSRGSMCCSESVFLSANDSELIPPNSSLSNMFPYYFLRFSGPLLFVVVGLKLLSGYALMGKLSGFPWLPGLHENPVLDIVLLFLLIFHALYGLRLFLIDLGMVKRESLLFWAATLLSAGLLVLSYIIFV